MPLKGLTSKIHLDVQVICRKFHFPPKLGFAYYLLDVTFTKTQFFGKFLAEVSQVHILWHRLVVHKLSLLCHGGARE